jgi:hypothetical protein
MTESDDRFELYDLKVEVLAGSRPMVCDHREGEYFHVIGEMIVFPAKQRATDDNDWMTTDTEVACPDPHCGGRFRITRVRQRTFRHAETTVPLQDRDAP